MVAGTAAGAVASEWGVFRRQLANTLHYWHERVQNSKGAWAEFDADSHSIARSVEYGLQIPEARAAALGLLAAARDPIRRRWSTAYRDDLVALIAQTTRKVAEPDPDRTAQIVRVTELAALLYYHRGRSAESERCYRQAITAASILSDRRLLCHLQVEFGRFLIEYGSAPEGLALLTEALSLAQRLGDQTTVARALVVLGWYYCSVSDGEAAERYLLQALPIVEGTGKSDELSRVWLNLGNAHRRMHDYARARADYECAMLHARRWGDDLQQALITARIGVLHYDLDRFREAVEYMSRAEEVYRRLGIISELASTSMNLSAAYWGLHEWVLARQYAQSALELWRTLGQEREEARTLLNLAEIEVDSGARGAAAKLLRTGREIIERQSTQPGMEKWTTELRSQLETVDLRLRQARQARKRK